MADYSIEVAIPNRGPVGPQGEVGPVGPANELTLGEVTTGDPGTEAEATISGTPPNQVLDLVLPRGDTGAQGNPGPTGAGGAGVVPAPVYATMQEAVEDGITFGGVFRHTSGSVFWVEEPDPDVATFIAASGATDVWNIQKFVQGVKTLGLWDDMVCWPLRSAQNAGTGTVAYSLGGLGTFNGTLVNGPTWGADGITVDATNKRIATAFNFTTGLTSIFGVIKPDSAAAFNLGDRFMGNEQGGTANGIGFDGFPVNQFRLLSESIANVGTRAAGTRTLFGHGYGTDNTFWFQDGSRTSRANTNYNASTQTLAIIGQPQAIVATMLGEYSFALAFDGVTTTSGNLSEIYTLYKTTLGIGLGLP
jgi:hypothetical protein